jgi:ASC-1-like (ASCH) protein
MEVKGSLARLLATENLIVEHRNVETAMFNVVDRVLTLPMWKRASVNVYDMLVGHEVGHALYTPQKFGQDYGVPQSYLNVVEDARIEKLMKRKFPGLARNFYAGYQELHDEDFFAIGDRSLNSYTLIDRINLYFKIGIHANEMFGFEKEETPLVDMVANAETFEEVVEAARAILKYTKEKEMEKVAEIPNAEELQSDTAAQSNSAPSSIQQSDVGESEEEKVQSEEKVENTGAQTGAGDLGGDFKSETDSAFTESQKNLVNKEYGDIDYVEMPPLSIDTFVVKNETVMEECNATFSEQNNSAFQYVDSAYLEYRKEAQREVSFLVKEFEMRKSADQYARSHSSKTGVLDTSKLHTFKWNEDLFKKVNVIPDGKNHGLIFILDWSGSMGQILMDTAKQLLNIAWFCKKTQIPFDVYAFTNNYWYDRNYDHEEDCVQSDGRHHDKKAGYIEISSYFRLLNLISSNGKNGKDLEKQLLNFWRLVYGESMYCGYTLPIGYGLSGTPLNESVIALTAIIPDFQKRTKVQKTNVIILTDGEAQSISYNKDISWGGVSKIGQNHIGQHCVLRDRVNGRVYPSFTGSYYSADEITSTFLTAVRNRFPDVNLIGIRLTNGRGLSNAIGISKRTITDADKIQKEWRKSKSAEISDYNGYQKMYFIGSDNIHNDDNSFEVAQDATKSQIRNAFKKSLSKKAVNKKMLTSFATMVS